MPQTTQGERADVAASRQEPGAGTGDEPGGAPTVVVDDLTIEDVSIDGMCGVY
jgi:mycofactocin precursor